MSDIVSVLVADDHPVVRSGLLAVLEDDPGILVVGEAGDGLEAVALTSSLRPDVVLLDVRMPRLDGIDAIARIAQLDVATRVLMLTTSDDQADVVRAIEAGARGYVLKQSDAATLIKAVHDVAAGQMVLSPGAAAQLAAKVRGPQGAPVEALTARELEVLRRVATGLTNIQIGQQLFVAEATVKTHLQRVYDKLGVRDRTGAVTTAIRLGLIDAS